MAKQLGLTRRLITLDNFLQDGGRPNKINSPRSLEACLRQGIDPSELIPLKMEVFIKMWLLQNMNIMRKGATRSWI